MLSEKQLKFMIRDHETVLRCALLGEDARLWYTARLGILKFVLEGDYEREPPTNNSLLAEFKDGGMRWSDGK